MLVDILYVSFNRLEFTKQTFTALMTNTDWEHVRTLYVADDGSTDGTREWLVQDMEVRDIMSGGTFDAVMNTEPFGGPVAAMNWYLDDTEADPVEIFAKVDNDMVVCPGWLPEMLRQMELHPRVDLLGMEPFLGDPAMPGTVHRDIEPCEHIGGKGLFRRRAFEDERPQPGGENGMYGFTDFQVKHPGIHKAWIKPDLPVFGLDQVRPEHGPWRAMAEKHAATGVARRRIWPCYASDDHYSWWTPV